MVVDTHILADQVAFPYEPAPTQALHAGGFRLRSSHADGPASLAAEAHAQEVYDAWLAESMAAANKVARAVSDQFKDRDEALTVTANRGTDGPDDPAVVFVVRITIADDFDPDDWPGDLVAEAKESVRTRAVERLPESMPFYVVVSQRTPSPAA